jgi:hypothetical protein
LLCAWIRPLDAHAPVIRLFFLFLASLASVLSVILSVLLRLSSATISANQSYFEAFAKVFIFSISANFLFLRQTYKFSIYTKLSSF